jgi:PAS domain S-box-containing protein
MFKLGRASSFATAGAIIGVAIAVRAGLDLVLPGTPPFITLYPAIALAGLLCGPLPAGLAALPAILAALFMWIPPRMSFTRPNLTDGVSVGLFVGASAIVLWATAVVRAQRQAAMVAKQALDLGLAAGGVGTWAIQLRTGRISASPAAYALHGLPEDARTTPDEWLHGVHPEDAEAAKATLRAAIAAGTTASYTYRILGLSDGPRWISARGRVVAEDEEPRLLCTLVDVTEQIRAQEELWRERERLRLALEAGALAVWDYHPDTKEVTIDARYAMTMGFDSHTGPLTRAQIGARIHPEDRPRVAAEHEAQVASGGKYCIEYRFITPSGQVRWLQSQGKVIESDKSSEPGRMVGIIQDITDRKRREDDLQALAAARELLVREADHRIKNSLQMVNSLLSVQLRGIEDPAAANALRGAIARVGAIAASHLALQGSADLKSMDLTVTLQDLCGHFTALHPGIVIDCRTRLPLMLDADRAIPLSLAVSEMLTNAIRHAFPQGEGGMIVVAAEVEESELIVRISDNGAGFEPGSGGDGLGSRIIRALAAQIDAQLDVESTPRSGTVATLRLATVPSDPAVQEIALRR